MFIESLHNSHLNLLAAGSAGRGNPGFWDTFVRELVYQLGIEPHRVAVVVVATIGIYVAFMLLVKIFGSRVLTSMTASDAVIIIMFGAVSGRVIVGNPPTLASGVVGLTTLMLLEATFGTFRNYVRWTRILDRRPVLIMYHGLVHRSNARAAHVSEADIHSALRKAGIGTFSAVQLMILEPTGQISIIRQGQEVDPAILSEVVGAEIFGHKEEGPAAPKQ